MHTLPISQAIYKNLLMLVMTLSISAAEPDTTHKIGHIGKPLLPVEDVSFYSKSLERDMHINVVLPNGYKHSETRYPVLYLCHGFTSNYHEFKGIGVPEYLNRFDMMVVMVDVGNSFYVNWAQSDSGKPLKFADHVCKDVIGYVDKHYRTIAERKGRAINGISMGGFGAISLGLSHPELFCSIGSHSGALAAFERTRKQIENGEEVGDMTKSPMMQSKVRYLDIDIEGFSTFAERTPKGKGFLTVEQIDKVDPFKLVLQIPKDELPHIYIDCGYSDFLVKQSDAFVELLRENKIPFQYGQSAGVHEEDYWGREISVSMAVQYAIMLRHIWGKEFQRYDPFKR